MSIRDTYRWKRTHEVLPTFNTSVLFDNLSDQHLFIAFVREVGIYLPTPARQWKYNYVVYTTVQLARRTNSSYLRDFLCTLHDLWMKDRQEHFADDAPFIPAADLL